MAAWRNLSAHRLAVLAFGLLLPFAGICQAQDIQTSGGSASSDLTEKMLASGDPRLIVWGAHYAIAAKNQEVVPQLLDVAERWQATHVDLSAEMGSEDDPTDQHDATTAVLDAIIQLHAQVSPSTLRNLAVDFPNQVAILLSRLSGDESTTLRLEFYRMQPHTRAADNLQYVGGALLAKDPPPGFAAELFSSIHNRAIIKITRPGYSEESTYATGIGGSCFVDDTHQVGWPTFGTYEL